MNLHKVFVKFLFAAILVASFGSSVVFAATTGVTKESNINVRASNSTESDILDKLAYNTPVTIIDKVDGWYKISIADGQTAFIHSDFINVTSTDAVITGSSVNVRKGPSTSSEVITQLNVDAVVTTTGISGDFYQVNINGEKAYVNKNFLSGSLLTSLAGIDSPVANKAVQSTYAVVLPDDGLNLRDTSSTNGAVLQALAKGELIDVLESSGDWVKVKADTNVVGYVNSKYVSLHTGEKPLREKTAPAPSNSLGQQVIDYGKKFLGTPYVWGGTSLTKGVDCSGFVYSVYKHFGYTLNRNSASMAANGVSVKKSELKVGDIILFDTSGANNGRISHVGIYMGDGKFIHSSSSRKSYSVTISSLNEAYYSKAYVSARRIIK